MKPTKKLYKLLDKYLDLVKYGYISNFKCDSKYYSETFYCDNAFLFGSMRDLKTQISLIDFNLLVKNISDEKLKILMLDSLIKLKTEIDNSISDTITTILL